MYVVLIFTCLYYFFFFKQKTAYEMRISDWSSDVCSSDLQRARRFAPCDIGIGAALILQDFFDESSQPFGALAENALGRADQVIQIGRASCRERVCQYV